VYTHGACAKSRLYRNTKTSHRNTVYARCGDMVQQRPRVTYACQCDMHHLLNCLSDILSTHARDGAERSISVAELGSHPRFVPRHIFRGKGVPSQYQPFQSRRSSAFHWALVISESVMARLMTGSSSVFVRWQETLWRQACAMRLEEAFVVTWAR
jgi:hypothetical protein